LADFLPNKPENRLDVLIELVHVDLERRCQNGQPKNVEAYFDEFPELRADSSLVAEFIAAELRLRRRFGFVSNLEDYASRFPAHESMLSAYFGGPAQSNKLQISDPSATLSQSAPPDAPAPPGRTRSMSDAAALGRDDTLPLSKLPGSAESPRRRIGEYEILEEIGRGGMGVVYKARHVALNRVVALKMILGGRFASRTEVERFRTEAEAAAKLDHPGIVPIYEIGEHDGEPYFSMGYVGGPALSERLRAGPLPPTEAARLVHDVARAVEHAHARGVIHRDLKPQNILLDAVGRPKVTDFGLAKLPHDRQTLTATGQILGTPAYMPPEQAAGKRDQIGPASDVYSLGAILYSLVTGRAPFQSAEVLDTLRQVLEQEPIPVQLLNPAVPRELDAICSKCLQKEPARRFGSAREFADELSRFLAGEPIRTHPPSMAYLLRLWLRKNLQATLVTLIVGVVCGGLAGLALALFWLPTMLEGVARPYDALPSVEPPWLLTWLPLPQPLRIGIGIFGVASQVLMGLVAVLYIQPRNWVSDLWIGAGAGLFAGVTAFVIAGGPVAVVSQSMLASYDDVVLIGTADENPQAVVEKYPDLEPLPHERRVRIVAAKVIADITARVPVGVWLGLLVTLGNCLLLGVCGALVAGRLLRSFGRKDRAAAAYVEFSLLCAFLLCFMLAPMGLTGLFIPEYLPDDLTGNAGLVLLAAAFLALVQNWPWQSKAILWAALSINLLLGIGILDFDSYLALPVYAAAGADSLRRLVRQESTATMKADQEPRLP
jgi:tRNA A-37 threonylcarbamoyl transferase component Bud32